MAQGDTAYEAMLPNSLADYRLTSHPRGSNAFAIF